MHRYNSPSTGWKQSLIACLGMMLISATVSVAQTHTWDNGAGNNDWDTAANWVADEVPTNGTVIINDVDANTNSDYCVLFTSKDVTELEVGITDQAGASFYVGDGSGGLTSVLNVASSLTTGSYRRQCALDVCAWGTLNACVNSGDMTIGEGQSGVFYEDEWSELYVHNKGSLNCYGNFYLGKALDGGNQNLDYHSQTRMIVDGTVTIDPVNKSQGNKYCYLGYDPKAYAEADIYGNMYCESSTNGPCVLQIGSSSYSGSAPQAIMTIHDGGVVEADDLVINTGGRLVLIDTGTLILDGNKTAVISQYRENDWITVRWPGASHPYYSLYNEYDSQADKTYVYVKGLWTNADNDNDWFNQDNWFRDREPTLYRYAHIAACGSNGFCTVNDTDSIFGVRVGSGEEPGAELNIIDVGSNGFNIENMVQVGFGGMSCELNISNSYVNLGIAGDFVNNFTVGSGKSSFYDENGLAVMNVEDNSTLELYGSLNIGAYMNASLYVGQGSTITIHQNIVSTSSKTYIYDNGMNMAYGNTSYATADIYGSIISYGTLVMANPEYYTDTFPGRVHAQMTIYDGGHVEAGGLAMCKYSPNGHIDLRGSAKLVINSSAEEIDEQLANLDRYIREGWITAYDGDELVVYEYDPATYEITVHSQDYGLSARCPTPADGANDVPSVTSLQWEAGENSAGEYRVFWGASESAVEAANTSSDEYKGVVYTTEKSASFSLGQTWYWRIDQKDNEGNWITGKVWSFEYLNYTYRMFAVWPESSMKRVFPDSRPEEFPDQENLEYSISMAQNETEDFQLVVLLDPTYDLSIFDFDIQVQTPAGSDLTFDWFQVGYVWIGDFWVDGKGEYLDPAAKAGWWPDVLLPVDTFDFDSTNGPERYAQPVWISVKAPSGTTAGIHECEVTVRMLWEGSEYTSTTVDVDVEVYDFALPDGPGKCKTAFSQGMSSYFNGKEEYYAYLQHMLDYKLNPNHLYRDQLEENIDQLWTNTSTDYFSAFLAGGLNAINIYRKGDVPGIGENYETFLTTYPSAAPAAYVYSHDEQHPRESYDPSNYYWPGMPRNFAWYKTHAPNVETMTTAYLSLFWADPTVWTSFYADADSNGVRDIDPCDLATGDPVSDMYRYSIDDIVAYYSVFDSEISKELKAHDMEMWIYGAYETSPRYADYFLYYPLMECRTQFWQMFDQEAAGVAYYIMISRMTEISLDASNVPFADFEFYHAPGHPRHYGCGQLMYRGPSDGGTYTPIASIRMANLRDGVEDYNYLAKLEELYGSFEKADAYCQEVAWDWDRDYDYVDSNGRVGNFSHDPSDINDARDAIAAAIVAASSLSTNQKVYNENDGVWSETIAAAVDASSNGDVLIVQPGTYEESITLADKDLTLRTIDPRDASVTVNTVLKGDGSSSVVSCNSNSVVLEGFTIQNGLSTVDDTDLLFHMKLDEDAGTNAFDSSSNGYTGTLMNFSGTNDWVAGRMNGALEFDGIDDYVESGYFNTTSSCSFSAWVKPDAVPESHQPIFCRGTSNLWRNGVYLYGSKVYCYFYFGTTRAKARSVTGTITPGVWQHIAVVMENNTPKVFVNGEDVTDSSFTVTGVGSFYSYSQYPLVIGRGDYDTDEPRLFNGLLDDLRIYSDCLTTSEIEQLAFRSDVDTNNGAGIKCVDSTLTIRDCVIKNNYACDNGGGLYAEDSDLTIKRCSFENNIASRGGAIMLSECDLESFDQVWVDGNIAEYGSGIYVKDVETAYRLTNSLFCNNVTESDATIYAVPDENAESAPDFEIVGCTVADNISYNGTAGLLLVDTANQHLGALVNSCIFWDNDGDGSSAPIVGGANTVITVDYSCIEDGWSGTNNTSSDPQFGDDYTLTASSTACINKGDPVWGNIRNGLSTFSSFEGEDYSGLILHVDERFDVDGDRRVNNIFTSHSMDYRFDMGAQEYVVPITE